ncbi:MAG: nucleotide sugar dehydrogenase [Candidatus Omnitrophica bacterium]|nr:nucleotide sugar dehydrogenase [Candidatus Omnitrophota bacterium]MBU1925702.1 nucleotide sugar dehydrogenase [Candidatus Omnitrophota bacterium]
MNLLEKIRRKKAKCAVIGLGYVGLPLAVELAKAGFYVVGIDLDANRVKYINDKKSYIADVKARDIKEIVAKGRLYATNDYSYLLDIDTINICVPTPLRKTRDPDISFIVESCRLISRYLHKGQLIILESTTYPGTTEEVVLPMFEKTGLKAGRDFFLAFSPERVDPANPKYKTTNIPKVVGGITKTCTEAATVLYEQIVDKVVAVSSTRVAETVKLLENTFRSVNIGLVNEIALMCNKMSIDVWEVIDAAATKPFGFMPFYPGPGLGGHCIPIDPLYLAWKARSFGFEMRFIELAAQVNSQMPQHVVGRIDEVLNFKKKSINASRILILGVAYKKDVADARESPAAQIIELLKQRGAKVQFHDPFINKLRLPDAEYCSVKFTKKALTAVDLVAIVTDHSNIDYTFVVNNSKLILDTRNALKGMNGKKRQKIFTL